MDRKRREDQVREDVAAAEAIVETIEKLDLVDLDADTEGVCDFVRTQIKQYFDMSGDALWDLNC